MRLERATRSHEGKYNDKTQKSFECITERYKGIYTPQRNINNKRGTALIVAAPLAFLCYLCITIQFCVLSRFVSWVW